MKIPSLIFLLLVSLQVQAQIPAGALMHLEGDVGIIESGGKVTEWRDTNNPLVRFIAPLPENQPTANIPIANGHKAVRFDGLANYLAGPSIFPVNQDYTICVVSVVTNHGLSNNVVSGTTHALFFGAGMYPVKLHANFNSLATSRAPVRQSHSIIFSRYNQSNTFNGFYVNGSFGDSAAVGVNTDTTVYLGAFDRGNFLGGEIAEVFIYPRYITDDERVQLENHLFDKYSIERPQLPDTTFTEIPQHFQLYPRDEQDSAVVRIVGRVFDSSFDSVYTVVKKNGEFMQRIAKPLFYPKGVAGYELLPKIHAELAEYDLKIYLKSEAKDTLIAGRDSITCGDVYIIDGQSNTVWGGDVFNPFENEYCRTFGLTASSFSGDTLWSRSTGNLGANAPKVGGWGMRLQQRILEEQAMPTCFINGGVSGTTIEAHQRNDPAPYTLTSIYGSLLYRVKKAKVAEAAKAIFWYQGESNTVDGYYGNFKAMYDDWKEDYPNFKKLYMFQHHMGCGGESSPIRELQRTFPDSLPNVVQVSVMGINGHDGCHYTTVGYTQIGDMVYHQVARDFYRSDDTINIDPPNITKAFYRGESQQELVLEFSPKNSTMVVQKDTVVSGVVASLKDYIYLDNDTSRIRSFSVEGNKVILHLRTPFDAEYISYLPDVNYNRTVVIYEGPWFVNARSVGALSFWRFPITDSVTLLAPSIPVAEIKISAYPNPSNGRTTIAYTVPNISLVTIEVTDVLGRHVQTLANEVMPAGRYEKILTSSADIYSSGVYYCRITTGTSTKTIRFILEQ
ncbi:MAG TPA: sialate O-acetylesterase [Candidatus Kapabacteria bacterium]